VTHEDIDTYLETEIDKATRSAACAHLALIREALAQHNLSRHKLTIKHGELRIHGQAWWKYTSADSYRFPVMSTLRNVGELIDNAKTWPHNLEGVTL